MHFSVVAGDNVIFNGSGSEKDSDLTNDFPSGGMSNWSIEGTGSKKTVVFSLS